jgi:hypothetical protein
MKTVIRILTLALLAQALVFGAGIEAQSVPTLEIELEGGIVGQSRNDVQIPNDLSGTRFSLADLAGKGPWPAGRLYLTWNFNSRHSLRALLAPLSVTEAGALEGPTAFAGETFQPGTPVVDLWVGFTGKLRDAKVALRQGNIYSEDTDLGFVPLLHLAADWRVFRNGNLLFDFDGLAGGPGRAVDSSLKLGYDLGDRWRLTLGYRTLEGGADVESVYNFAWLHYGVASFVFRF